MKFRTQGTGDIGISGYDGNNTWMFQLMVQVVLMGSKYQLG